MINSQKIFLLIAALSFSVTTMAQKSKIRSATMYLEEKDYTKAISSIEEALANPDTKDNPDAWYTQGAIYLQMIAEKKINEQDGLNKAYTSLIKVIELKPNYDAQKLDAMTGAVGSNYFNQAVEAYNNRKYADAVAAFKKTTNLMAPGGKSRFANNPRVDTLIADARKYHAFASVYNQQPADAIPVLEQLKNDPIAKSEEIYSMLVQAYEATDNESGLINVLSEARKLYPTNKNFVNSELNYYIKKGRTQELVSKLEETLAKEPNNEDLLFTLGITYDNMANPRDASGKELPKPANADELITKAAAAYDKALAINPTNIGYLYNRATLYFNKGVQYNKEMNAITGMSAAEQKKYDELKVKRNNEFAKSLPLFEKIYAEKKGKFSSLNPEDKISYQQTLLALSQIYNINGNTAKANEVKSEMDGLK